MARCLRVQPTGLWRIRFTKILRRPVVEMEFKIPYDMAPDDGLDRFFWDMATMEDLESIGFAKDTITQRITFAGVKK